MPNSYRGSSRGADSSSGSSSGGSHHGRCHPVTSGYYPPTTTGQHSYYPASGQHAHASPQLLHAHYATSSQLQSSTSKSVYGHHRTPSGTVSRQTGQESSTSAPERASKRQRAGAVPDQDVYMQAQWVNVPAQSSSRYPTSTSHTSRGDRHGGRDGSLSSGYNSPGYSHDTYGHQLLQSPPIPGVGPLTMQDPYSHHNRHSLPPSSEEEEEEYVDHGPTELPPRTYSGKSRYDPPRKPGKIPGSAMDYLPILEARFDRLETAIDRYVDYRGQRALSNSILPGMDASEGGSPSGAGSSSSRQSRGSSRR